MRLLLLFKRYLQFTKDNKYYCQHSLVIRFSLKNLDSYTARALNRVIQYQQKLRTRLYLRINILYKSHNIFTEIFTLSLVQESHVARKSICLKSNNLKFPNISRHNSVLMCSFSVRVVKHDVYKLKRTTLIT